MSNSPLVSYTSISPNSSPRVKPIRKITPHHMAAKLSVETCCAIFASPARQASSNYVIGYDARVGLCVPEERRAWTSSNWDNDQEAITIEVSNSAIGGDWPVSDECLESLTNLCVDICRRNGIKGLTWTGDKDGSLTCHYMFAPTACPGQFTKTRMAKLANDVNSRLAIENGGNELKEIKIPSGTYNVHRLFNEYASQHWYTSDDSEVKAMVKDGWKDEGIAWKGADTGDVFYRMFNPYTGSHTMTIDYKEAASNEAAGWKYEGANIASARNGIPIHRLYNEYEGDHIWTIDEQEVANLKKLGWTYEKVAGYAVKE